MMMTVHAEESSSGAPSQGGIAFLGDSIVQNPMGIIADLDGTDWNGILGRTDCFNYGIGGQTSKECLSRIQTVAQKKHDKLVILCGINDIGSDHTNQEVVSNFKNMIQSVKAENPNIKIYILSVLPTTDRYFTGYQHLIVALNKELKTLADSLDDVTFVDCHAAFVAPDGYCKEYLTFDGLHPNKAGYAKIAEILSPYLTEEEISRIPPQSDSLPVCQAPQPQNDGQTNLVVIGLVALLILLVFTVGFLLWKNKTFKKKSS